MYTEELSILLKIAILKFFQIHVAQTVYGCPPKQHVDENKLQNFIILRVAWVIITKYYPCYISIQYCKITLNGT